MTTVCGLLRTGGVDTIRALTIGTRYIIVAHTNNVCVGIMFATWCYQCQHTCVNFSIEGSS